MDALVRSMTGFGRGVAEHGNVRATVDLRSVNHRFLDLKLRATIAPALEDALAAKIRGALERGSVSVAVHILRAGATSQNRIDEVAAQAAYDALVGVAHTLGIPGPDLALVLAQPGVVVTGDDREEAPDAAVLAAVDTALAQLQQMRAVEGRVLERELGARLGELAQLSGSIEALAVAVPGQAQARLADRLRRLLTASGTEVDPARLAQEVALIAERADITEELVRLGSHLDQAKALVAGAGSSGRRLDFLIQEIGRELNTIGSKSQITQISSAVVEAKAVLEKLREQVQNVE